MADDKEKYDFGNTNAEEILTILRSDEGYYEEMEKYVPASFDFFGCFIEKTRILANIPDITFNYDDNIIYDMECIVNPILGKDPCDNWKNYYLTGKDGGIAYTLVISFERVEKGFGKCYIYPHRIDENGNVEIFDTTNKTWVITDPGIMKLIRRESGYWAGENLVEAFQNLADILGTCSTVDEADDILWENQKLFALYRNVKSFVDLKVDNQWASEDMIYLMPKDPFRKRLSIIQIKNTLVLGCITNLEDGKPKFVEIYDINHEGIMAELLKTFCREGVYKREDGNGPEWGSGHILSYEDKPENGFWMLDDTFMNDRNSADIPVGYKNNEDTEGIPRTNGELFSLDLIMSHLDGRYTIFEDSAFRIIGLLEPNGRRSNLTVIQLKDQLVLGCRFYPEEGSHNFKLITLYDTDSKDEMAEALKIVYMVGPYSRYEDYYYFSDLSSGDIYPFEVSSRKLKKREQGDHIEADQPTVSHSSSEAVNKKELNVTDFDNVNPRFLDTTEKKLKYLISQGVIELEPDEEIELLNADEFDDETEFYINYMFENFYERANQGIDFPPFFEWEDSDG